MLEFVLTAPILEFPENKGWYLKLDLNSQLPRQLRRIGKWNGNEEALKRFNVSTVFVNRLGGYFVPSDKHQVFQTLQKTECVFPMLVG